MTVRRRKRDTSKDWTGPAFQCLITASHDDKTAMTWSIIARDPGGAYGVAIASKFFAVGAICPHGEGSVGALSTQALPNPLWGYRGMRLLREGMAAQAVVDHLVTPDKGAEQRQLHVHDARGAIAVHTGARCIDWCGHVVRPGVWGGGNSPARADAGGGAPPGGVGGRSGGRRPGAGTGAAASGPPSLSGRPRNIPR